MSEQLMPSNVEAEQTLFGILLWEPDVMDTIAGLISAQDFYRDAHRTIYATMCHMHTRQSLELIAVSDTLERHGLSFVADTPMYEFLRDLLNAEMESLVFESRRERATALAKLIAQLAEDRAVAEVCYQGWQMAHTGTENLLSQVEASLASVRKQRKADEMISIGDYYPTYLARIDALMQAGDGLRGIPTGFKDLDALTGGFQRGELYVPAARPGVGKTTICQNFTYTATVKHHKRVGFFSLEMNKDALMDRFIADHTAHISQPIDSQSLRNARLTDADMRLLTGNVLEVFAELGIYLAHTPGITIEALRGLARSAMARHNLDMIVVDYLQLLKATDGKGKRLPRTEEVAEIARQLKEMAGELNVPVIAPAQINREIEHRTAYKFEGEDYTYKLPMLSDLKESGEIEQSADAVMFLARAEEKEQYVKLFVAKHRMGDTGILDLYFKGSETRFYPLVEVTL